MAQHDWQYGFCQRCGHSTDLSGGSNEDAPPCIAYEPETAQRLVETIIAALGTPDPSPDALSRAVQAAQTILDEDS